MPLITGDASSDSSSIPQEDRDPASPPSSVQNSSYDSAFSGQKDDPAAQEDILQNLVSTDGEELLGFVDNLRGTHSLHDVPLALPQLVVVGNTSSGKSSLLQTITKLPFPVDADICTRFATETVIRRCKSTERPHYTIKIEQASPGEEAPFSPFEYYGDDWLDVAQHLRQDLGTAFDSMNQSRSNSQEAEAIAYSAVRRMQINDSRPQLSEDIMKVEVYKPNQAHFSVVDIPGLVSSGLKQDVKLSVKLARQYISNPRAIVLAVIPAVDALHNQKVLNLVQEANATSRTIGVVTKCDMLKRRDESKTLELLKNSSSTYRLPLGWFAIRNRTTEELENNTSHAERDDKEQEFFDTRPWSSVSREWVGVEKLRTCLSKTLYKHVKDTFPDLQKDIKRKLQDTKRELEILGKPRNTPHLQQIHLSAIQRKYEDLAKEWLSGQYKEGCDVDDASKLRWHMNNHEDQFAEAVSTNSLEYRFYTPDEVRQEFSTDEMEENDSTGGSDKTESWEELMGNRGDVYSWILSYWNSNRGDGMWYKQPRDIEERLLKEQIRSWRDLATDYFTQALESIETCTNELYMEACPDENIRRKIMRATSDDRQNAVSEAMEALDTIIQEQGRMKTYNPRFGENVKTSKSERTLPGLHDSKQTSIYAIHDNVRDYWEVAVWRFVDNVIVQVVERHLLGPKGPIFCFSMDWVADLSEEQLENLIGEDADVRKKREELHRQIDGLDKALKEANEILRW